MAQDNYFVLLVDRDSDARRATASALGRHEVAHAATVDEAHAFLAGRRPDLVMLDWDFPDTSGRRLLQSLRRGADTSCIPVMIVSARTSEHDVVSALEAGADDYVRKPFFPRELLARMQSVLRARKADDLEEELEIGGLRLQPDRLAAFAGDRALQLSVLEFRLLHFFMQQPGRVLSRQRIIEHGWNGRETVEPRSVDVYIRRLRLALGVESYGRRIITIPGEGYCFRP
jgi:two-component system, OmpR family, phosphate regulon response regulator PhoB